MEPAYLAAHKEADRLVRLYKRLCRDERHDLVRPGPWLNAVLERLFALERHVVPTPALPFGTSMFLTARRS